MQYFTESKDSFLFVFEGVRHILSITGIVALVIYVIL